MFINRSSPLSDVDKEEQSKLQRTTVQVLPFLPRLALVLLLAVAFFGLTLPILAAIPGDLDPNFGNSGVVTPTLPISPFLANTIAIQSDGKIVTAGGDPATDGLFVILRHNLDGNLDSSFGHGGVVTTSLGSSAGLSNQGPVGLVRQSNGKIVIVGSKRISSTLETLALARYTVTGSLDSTFGQSGVVTTVIDNSVDVFFIGVAIQADDKIVVAGESSEGISSNSVIARYTLTGSLDSSFGNSGLVTTSLVKGVRGVALQSNGKIVVAGSTGGTSSAFALARYTITGSLDSTFGSSGVVTTPIGDGANMDAVAIQPDDKIIAIGSSSGGGTYTFALARYNSDGSLDSGFGSSGVVTTSINGYGDGNGIALQPDGKIVAVGTGKTITNSNTFALVRYNNDGSLDSSFGSNGIIATPIGSSSFAWNVAIQPDHKIVVVGDSDYASESRYTLARYFGDALNLQHRIYLPMILKS